MDRGSIKTQKTRVASIDIGTNTILMLIADVDENCNIIMVEDYHQIARLGENLRNSGNISDNAIYRAIDILKFYRNEIEKHKVEKIFSLATSAMRSAKNAQFVKHLFEEILGSEILIIDGELEAAISFHGSIEDNFRSVVLDIGGGSSEIISGERGKIDFKISLSIGSVSLTEKYFHSYPIEEKTILDIKKELFSTFSLVDPNFIAGKIYAVAGTPTTLAMCSLGLRNYDRNLVHNFFLDLQTIQNLRAEFQNLTVNQIIAKYHIHPMRADVILAGTLILEAFCQFFRINGVITSDKGLRYGAINYFFCKEFIK